MSARITKLILQTRTPYTVLLLAIFPILIH